MQKILIAAGILCLLGTTVQADLWTDLKDSWAKAQEKMQPKETQRPYNGRVRTGTEEKGWVERLLETWAQKPEQERREELRKLGGTEEKGWVERLLETWAQKPEQERREELRKLEEGLKERARTPEATTWMDRLKQKADEAYARYKEAEQQRQLQLGRDTSTTTKPWYEQLFGKVTPSRP